MLSSADTVQPDIQRCCHSEHRQCPRGCGCREASCGSAEVENVGLNSQLSLRADASSKKLGNRIPVAKVCRHFVQKGWCAFGHNCVFLHSGILPTDEQNVSVEANADLELCGEPTETNNEAELRNRAQRGFGPKVCRFFKSGYCRYGQKCKYRHVHMVSETCRSRQLEENATLNKNTSSEAEVAVALAHAEGDENALLQQPGSAVENCPQDVHGRPKANKSPDKLQASPEEQLYRMRKTEIQQLHRRYPKAQEISQNGQTVLKFTFQPSDPEWPYDVKQMNMEVAFPEGYPAQMMIVQVKDNERIPTTVERVLTDSVQEWVCQRYFAIKSTSRWEMMFRPMLQWLDRNAENVMTEALKEYKRELMAKAAGVEFIPATKLRELYPDAVNSSSQIISKATDGSTSKADEVCIDQDSNAAVQKLKAREDKEDISVEEPKEKAVVDVSSSAPQKGTEISLIGFQLTDGAATLVASQINLLVACARCGNTNEVHLTPGHTYRAECSYCHGNQLMEFTTTIAHQMSSVVGWLNLEGCRAFDLVLANCRFIVGCLNCSKEEKLNSISPGHPNSTWCRHCHQKLTVFVDCARFVHLAASVQMDASKAIQLDVKKRVKSVRDPAIQEGQPLPNNGACRHFRKSFRWFRFPCCGKAYPCDKCHDEKEKDHEMKLANRMICGFCAKEQAFSCDRPCMSCNSIITNKSTDHWEGGKGCRDRVRMARNDCKKYTNLMKTTASSSDVKTDPSKKTTKLRHVS